MVLDEAAFGGATPVEPKSISPTDPAARYTAAANTPAVYDAISVLIDYRPVKRVDLYAGMMISNVCGGLAKQTAGATRAT
jgi:hypothetical protein